ncbi:ThiF family adenylyltransferase [Pedobacter sp. GR22-6]|uniref:ThiF family adenylyltransferase n=1 Tax=Pedobacter sp. GR22-6 TaxID=3127957 RepID=UPI00307F5DB4
MSERYNRQTILDGFGEGGQQRLSQAKVLVIGAGGLGCPALQYLVAAGIGHVGIADDDTIALSNLHRQILYSTEDVGELKADVAGRKLKAMNPEISIATHPFRIRRDNILELLKKYDIILDGTDNFESRYLINDACALLAKPLVFAAVSGYEGQLAIFNAGPKEQRTNYRDIFPIPPLPGEIPNCAESGVLGVLPGILGTMAASETIKLISGIGEALLNQLLHYNLLNQAQYIISLSPNSDYEMPATEKDFLNQNNDSSSCELPQDYLEIDAQQLNAMQGNSSVLLIDVRENYEMPALDDGVFSKIPMSGFADFLDSNVEAENIVLICQHGIRSVAAAEALQQKYGATKKIYSLKGGIVKWRNQLNGIL